MTLLFSDETNEVPFGTPAWDDLMVEYRAFGDEARRRGAMIAGAPLQSTETATTLRLQGGRFIPIDGPYAETKEQLGGFYILECSDEAEAIELAALIPTAKYGSVEVRAMASNEARQFERSGTSYIVLIYGAEADYFPPGDPRMTAGISQHQALTERTIASGEYVSGDGLGPPSTAKTVSVRTGESLVVDGPFAETKEQLGGYYIFACADLDRALVLASEIPVASGSLEVRPLLEV
ncbi:MAG: YciI family protein [bacterium]